MWDLRSGVLVCVAAVSFFSPAYAGGDEVEPIKADGIVQPGVAESSSGESLKKRKVVKKKISNVALDTKTDDAFLASIQTLEKKQPGALEKYRLNNKKTVLHVACSHGFIKSCEFLLKKRSLLDVVDDDGNTALFLAAINRHEPIIALLLEHGVLLTLKNNKRQTILHLLVEHDCVESVKLLIAKHPQDYYALYWEEDADKKVVEDYMGRKLEVLTQQKADVQELNKIYEFERIIKGYYSLNSIVDDQQNKRALLLKGGKELDELVANSVTMLGMRGGSFLHKIIIDNDQELFNVVIAHPKMTPEFIMKVVDSDGYSLVYYALQYDRVPMMQALIKKGVSKKNVQEIIKDLGKGTLSFGMKTALSKHGIVPKVKKQMVRKTKQKSDKKPNYVGSLLRKVIDAFSQPEETEPVKDFGFDDIKDDLSALDTQDRKKVVSFIDRIQEDLGMVKKMLEK